MFDKWKNRIIGSEILGINERNMDYVYQLNPKKYFTLADDKVKCKELLHANNIACAKTYGVVRRIGDISRMWSNLNHYKKIAIKPANGSGGGGILILKKNAEGYWVSGGEIWSEQKIFTHMARIIMGMYSFGSSDHVLVEQCIEPHPFFAEIYAAGVPDFRIILIKDEPVMSMLRVPTDKSGGKANLHQGGLGIGIDMEKGTLLDAFDGHTYYTHHPDNGNSIAGKEIPMWNTLVALSIATSKCFPLDYLGIDIVIDAELGPLIMEINVRPGLGIQLANKSGLKLLLKAKLN
ncbi:MAG: sugar-transfer associated ATP-grasp domain-containing protein [Saprospiraceae bacterium]|nr:sugar-transfer associated ATP-grasp domain-containing protein [Saprospiraceae bacterium]